MKLTQSELFSVFHFKSERKTHDINRAVSAPVFEKVKNSYEVYKAYLYKYFLPLARIVDYPCIVFYKLVSEKKNVDSKKNIHIYFRLTPHLN